MDVNDKIGKLLSVGLVLGVKKRSGLLADVTATLTQLNVNISRLEAVDTLEHLEIKLVVQVEGRIQLAQIIRELRKVDGVLKIKRPIF